MKRRACPFLTYWTNGDTRNRGVAILRFKQAFADSGFTIGNEELPDHLAVVLEFAAVGDRVTGDALLAEHAAPIGLLREALARPGRRRTPTSLDAVCRDPPGDHPRGGRPDGRAGRIRPARRGRRPRALPDPLTPTGARR